MKNNKIEIFIDTQSDYVSNYNTKMLNPELKNYVLEELRGSNLKKGIDIKILGNYFDTEEKKEEFLRLFRNEFSLSIKDNIMYMKYSIVTAILLGIVGIVFIILSKVIGGPLFNEIFLIIGWLGVWEATARLVFDESKNYIIVKRLNRIVASKITFEKNK